MVIGSVIYCLIFREVSMLFYVPSKIELNVANAVSCEKIDDLNKFLEEGEISDEYRGNLIISCFNIKIIERLLESGPISVEDRGVAVKRITIIGNIEIIKKLLTSGAISDEDRGVAVRVASIHGYIEIIKVLLESGSISNEDKEAAINYAHPKIHDDVLELIRSMIDKKNVFYKFNRLTFLSSCAVADNSNVKEYIPSRNNLNI